MMRAYYKFHNKLKGKKIDNVLITQLQQRKVSWNIIYVRRN